MAAPGREWSKESRKAFRLSRAGTKGNAIYNSSHNAAEPIDNDGYWPWVQDQGVAALNSVVAGALLPSEPLSRFDEDFEQNKSYSRWVRQEYAADPFVVGQGGHDLLRCVGLMGISARAHLNKNDMNDVVTIVKNVCPSLYSRWAASVSVLAPTLGQQERRFSDGNPETMLDIELVQATNIDRIVLNRKELTKAVNRMAQIGAIAGTLNSPPVRTMFEQLLGIMHSPDAQAAARHVPDPGHLDNRGVYLSQRVESACTAILKQFGLNMGEMLINELTNIAAQRPSEKNLLALCNQNVWLKGTPHLKLAVRYARAQMRLHGYLHPNIKRGAGQDGRPSLTLLLSELLTRMPADHTQGVLSAVTPILGDLRNATPLTIAKRLLALVRLLPSRCVQHNEHLLFYGKTNGKSFIAKGIRDPNQFGAIRAKQAYVRSNKPRPVRFAPKATRERVQQAAHVIQKARHPARRDNAGNYFDQESVDLSNPMAYSMPTYA